VISSLLLRRVACPVCLEAGGCAECSAEPAGHEACLTSYARRAACPCGGPDKVRLDERPGGLLCPCCGVFYPLRQQEGYLDLVPRTRLGEVTQYADHDFQERLRVSDAPPLLSARVKADMMRGMLGLARGEALLDLGCGAGKLALYASSKGAETAGLDVSPFFLPRAAREVDLVLGDLRRLPFRKGSFPRAYSLDVLEHLDETGVREVLLEARRSVGEGGRVFVYTHAMESSGLARFQRLVNRLARRLGEAGLIDHEREALRKGDHRNAIQSHEHFDELCAGAGLRVVKRRYYNVFFKAVIEDLLLRLYEGSRRGLRGQSHKDAVRPQQGTPRAGRAAFALALGLTWLMKLDIVLFGGIRTGPFFGLLESLPYRRGGTLGAERAEGS